ncbi:MAG: hypothetical protein ACK5W9_11255 [Bdellovibrionales bacterium]
MSIESLLLIPDSQRDHDWENRFFDEFLKVKISLIDEGPQVGPDNWPYLLVETGEKADEPVINVIRWLHDKGIGLVVNPRKEYPDYVFPWGMIWNLKETGLFRFNHPPVIQGAIELKKDGKFITGPPNPQFLPDYVRKILKQFFLDQGLLQVKILVISQDQKHYDLAFSLESLGNPPEKERAGIAEAISWFLPIHYSVLLVSEKGLPQFVDL